MRSILHPLTSEVSSLPALLLLIGVASAQVQPSDDAGTTQYLATRFGPKVVTPALVLDVNSDGELDAGDQVRVRFDMDVVVNTSSAAGVFHLPVQGDSLGTGASLAAGPGSKEVTITLGSGPHLKARQNFWGGATGANSASGIDVSRAMPANAIVNPSTGRDAVPSLPADLFPGFVESAQVLDSGTTLDGALADLDCNGSLDLIVQNDGLPLKIWWNDGWGGLTHAGHTLGSNDPGLFAVGDLDKDGKPDVVETRRNTFKLAIWRNQGFGSFLKTFETTAGNYNEIALADLNGDGFLDLATANVSSLACWLYQPGAGIFVQGPIFGNPVVAKSIALGDVDRDGDLDLVSGNSGSASRLWLNDGNANFTDAGLDLGTGTTLQVLLQDLDGDGDLDLLRAVQGGEVHLWSNQGGASFVLVETLAAGGALRTCLFADVDADGRPDLVAGSHGQPNQVWRNFGDFQLAQTGPAMGSGTTTWLRTGDLDRDGDVDVVEGNDNEPKRAWLSSLSGAWGSADFVDSGQAIGPSETQDIALSDLDGDGDLDLVTANDKQPDYLWQNDGKGKYTLSGPGLGTDNQTEAVVAGDVDGDGDADLVIAGRDGTFQPALQQWVNDGTGAMSAGQAIWGEFFLSLVLVDADGDGDLDLISGNAGPDVVRLNDGYGKFVFTGNTLGTTQTNTLVAGDLDCDGKPDLVVGKLGGEANQVWRNTGWGQFVNTGQLLSTGDTWGLGLGDLDGNGSLDLIEGNSLGGQTNRVLLNDGLGFFTPTPQPFPPSLFTASIAVGDVDGDGDLDFFTGSTSTAANGKLWLNDGTASFTDSGQILGPRKTRALAVGDLDGDGDLDLVQGNSQGDTTRIWLNR
jgi:hypothetical protein